MQQAGRYDRLSLVLHWVAAILVFGLYGVGLLLDEMSRPVKLWSLGLHMSFGLVLLGLIVLRLARHSARQRPSENDTGSAVMELAGRLGHGLLYALMLLVTITGILRRTLRGRPLDFFGLQIPSPFSDLGQTLRPILKSHEVFAHALIALVALHVVAALWHHFVRRDNVLRSMLPGKG